MKDPKEMRKEELEAAIKEWRSAQMDQGGDVELNPDELDAVSGGKISENGKGVISVAVLFHSFHDNNKEAALKFCLEQTKQGGAMAGENPLDVYIFLDQAWNALNPAESKK